jgi:hypothetical protein
LVVVLLAAGLTAFLVVVLLAEDLLAAVFPGVAAVAVRLVALVAVFVVVAVFFVVAVDFWAAAEPVFAVRVEPFVPVRAVDRALEAEADRAADVVRPAAVVAGLLVVAAMAYRPLWGERSSKMVGARISLAPADSKRGSPHGTTPRPARIPASDPPTFEVR